MSAAEDLSDGGSRHSSRKRKPPQRLIEVSSSPKKHHKPAEDHSSKITHSSPKNLKRKRVIDVTEEVSVKKAKLFCPQCDRRFNTQNQFDYHVASRSEKSRHIIPVKEFQTDQHILVCPQKRCCFTAQDIETLRTHCASKHRKTSEYSRTSAEGDQYLSVVIRPDIALLKSGPLDKEVTHSKPFSCPHCAGGFTSKSAYNKHMSTPCDSRFPWSCNFCKNPFRTFNAMKRHMERIHPAPPSANCIAFFKGDPETVRKSEKAGRIDSVNNSADAVIEEYCFLSPGGSKARSAQSFFGGPNAHALEWIVKRGTTSGRRLRVQAVISGKY